MSISPRTMVDVAKLGAACGLRSMSPMMALAWATWSGQRSFPSGSLYALLANRGIVTAVTLMSAGEMIGDKLPFTPARVTPGPLLFRVGVGGLAGMARCVADEERPLLGAAIGATTAAATAVVAYWQRVTLARAGIPSPLSGLVEDGLALYLAFSAVGDLPTAVQAQPKIWHRVWSMVRAYFPR